MARDTVLCTLDALEADTNDISVPSSRSAGGICKRHTSPDESPRTEDKKEDEYNTGKRRWHWAPTALAISKIDKSKL